MFSRCTSIWSSQRSTAGFQDDMCEALRRGAQKRRCRESAAYPAADRDAVLSAARAVLLPAADRGIETIELLPDVTAHAALRSDAGLAFLKANNLRYTFQTSKSGPGFSIVVFLQPQHEDNT